MNVLWFEVTTPQIFSSKKIVVGGWQDALEHIVKSSGIELVVAFTSNLKKKDKVVDGVVYEPINIDLIFLERQKSHFSWKYEIEIIIEQAKKKYSRKT